MSETFRSMSWPCDVSELQTIRGMPKLSSSGRGYTNRRTCIGQHGTVGAAMLRRRLRDPPTFRVDHPGVQCGSAFPVLAGLVSVKAASSTKREDFLLPLGLQLPQ